MTSEDVIAGRTSAFEDVGFCHAPGPGLKLASRRNIKEGPRGPAAILFIARDSCSDSIANVFRACFCGGGGGYRTIIARYVAKWGIAQILDGQNRQSPIASDFGSRTQIAALFAVLLYPNV